MSDSRITNPLNMFVTAPQGGTQSSFGMAAQGIGQGKLSCLDVWLDKYHIHPRMVAEFDDSALMKVFGQEGAGIFIAPAVIEAEVEWQYQVTAIGRVDEVKEHFYANTVERRITHPVISVVMDAARDSLFVDA